MSLRASAPANLAWYIWYGYTTTSLHITGIFTALCTMRQPLCAGGVARKTRRAGVYCSCPWYYRQPQSARTSSNPFPAAVTLKDMALPLYATKDAPSDCFSAKNPLRSVVVYKLQHTVWGAHPYASEVFVRASKEFTVRVDCDRRHPCSLESSSNVHHVKLAEPHRPGYRRCALNLPAMAHKTPGRGGLEVAAEKDTPMFTHATSVSRRVRVHAPIGRNRLSNATCGRPPTSPQQQKAQYNSVY